MYPATGPDGQPVPLTDQMQQQQGNYVSGYGSVSGMSQSSMPQAYWPNPADQSQMQSMYMGGQQGMSQSGGSLDNGRRMVYNPATGVVAAEGVLDWLAERGRTGA